MKKLYFNDLINCKALSNLGSEFCVFHDKNVVYKIYKKNYKLGHHDKSSYELLNSLNTKRILMPKELIVYNDKIIGYTMSYIKNPKNIMDITIDELLKEQEIIYKDTELLSNNNIRLMDINKKNIIFNGKLYFIDPGNYYINNNKDLLLRYKETNYSEQDIVKMWNCDKVNKLFDQLLFFENEQIDFYMLRKIIEFFDKKREENNLLCNYSIYYKYFDHQLPVKDAITKFIEENIIINKDEKKLILSLYTRNKIIS